MFGGWEIFSENSPQSPHTLYIVLNTKITHTLFFTVSMKRTPSKTKNLLPRSGGKGQPLITF